MTGRANTILTAISAAVLLSSCAYTDGVTGTPAGANPNQELPTFWQSIATQADRDRISHWRRSFRNGVADAAAGGHAHEVAAEGVLLQPDAGLADPRPPAGDYRCRFIKLGSQGSVPLSFVAYPWFQCRIQDQGETLRFTKLTGSQRPSGTFYPENRLRMIFLGVLELPVDIYQCFFALHLVFQHFIERRANSANFILFCDRDGNPLAGFGIPSDGGE